MGRWVRKSLPGEPLFAASNSGRGFFGFYEDVFNRPSIERRYLIKGGPGTGKSHFLSVVAEAAAAKGRAVEHYRCSSDPDSLDGIVIDGKIALLDATAPHNVDADLPGARDELVNLGAFWDAEKLGAQKAEIAALTEQKRACYRRGYRFLAACDQLYEANRSLMLPLIKHEKLQKTVDRRLDALGRGDGFSLLPGLTDAVGMRGSVHLDSYERRAKHLFVIEDLYDTGALFLRALLTGGGQRAFSVRVSYHPIHVGEPDAVYMTKTDTCFAIAKGEVSDGENVTRIHMRRFVDIEGLRAVRTKLRMNARMYDALLDAAEEALGEAGKHHFALEEIYKTCMDFDAQNRFLRSFCEKIL